MIVSCWKTATKETGLPAVFIIACRRPWNFFLFCATGFYFADVLCCLRIYSPRSSSKAMMTFPKNVLGRFPKNACLASLMMKCTSESRARVDPSHRVKETILNPCWRARVTSFRTILDSPLCDTAIIRDGARLMMIALNKSYNTKSGFICILYALWWIK